jgi:hypothetical protein
MSLKSERNKSTQLGMSMGTASGRLKKLLLFSMAQRLGEDVCFRCANKIESVDDFTIDHKKDWLNADAGLFWDLENIAFSHSKCNVPGTRHGGYFKRKIGPVGTSWCAGHKNFLLVENFRSHAGMFNQLYRYCKECEAAKRKKYEGR